MDKKMSMVIFIFVLVLLPAFSAVCHAIPAFARKYKTTCMTCHTTPTMLNEFGLRFQANGYQLPGVIDKKPVWDQNIVPISFMLHAMWQWMKTKSKREGEPQEKMITHGFVNPHGNILSGGTLGKHISYFTRLFLEPTTLEIDTMYVIYNNILPYGRMSFRVGRFYPDLPFPSRLTLTEDIKPLIYTFTSTPLFADWLHEQTEHTLEPWEPQAVHSKILPPKSIHSQSGMFGSETGEAHDEGESSDFISLPNDILDSSKLGISLFGYIPDILNGTRYELAIFNIEKDHRPAYFFRVNQTVFVRNAPVRGGVFLLDGVHQAGGFNAFDAHFTRWGFEAEAYDPFVKKVNIQFVYMKGWDRPSADGTPGFSLDFTGGLLTSQVFIIPERLIFSGRYDWINLSDTKKKQWTADFRYHFLPNVFVDFIWNRVSGTGVIPMGMDEEGGHMDEHSFSRMTLQTEMSSTFEEQRFTNSMIMIMIMFIF